MTDTTTLAPCPFCGGNQTAAPHDTHRPGCYFLVLASVKASPDADVSWATDLIAAWNRRAPAPASFPVRITALLRDVADRNGTETKGPWEDVFGEPLQDDADAALAWIAAPPAQEARLNPDMPVQELRLHMGELTSDEVLVARSAIRWANSQKEARVPLTGEQQRCIAEAHNVAACEEYFSARPQIDYSVNRRIFEAGFSKGYDIITKK